MIVPPPMFISPPEGSLKGLQMCGRMPLIEVGSTHIWRANNVVGVGARSIVLGERRKFGGVIASNVSYLLTFFPSSRWPRDLMGGFV